MTLEEAFIDFTNSDNFREITKKRDDLQGMRYRTALSRFRKGKLGKAAIIEILEVNGYVIEANKAMKQGPVPEG